MFDVRPEEAGLITPIVMPTDQPIDNMSGELVLGPGAGGLQPQTSESRKVSPSESRHISPYIFIVFDSDSKGI